MVIKIGHTPYLGEFFDWELGLDKHLACFLTLRNRLRPGTRKGLKDTSRHVLERRLFTGLQLLKYRVNLALSCAVSGGGRREETGDRGEGLTALRGSDDGEYPLIMARGPAWAKVSRKFDGERIRRTHVC